MDSSVLNPLSKHYDQLKQHFLLNYSNDVRPSGPRSSRTNSTKYPEQCTALNLNAEAVVDFLHMKAEDPNSSVSAVSHLSVHQQKAYSKPACERGISISGPDTAASCQSNFRTCQVQLPSTELLGSIFILAHISVLIEHLFWRT